MPILSSQNHQRSYFGFDVHWSMMALEDPAATIGFLEWFP